MSIVFLLIGSLLSAVGLLFLINPHTSPAHNVICLWIAAFYGVLLVLWGRFAPRRTGKIFQTAVFWLGIVVFSVPFLIYLAAGVHAVWGSWQRTRFAAGVVLRNYQESPILRDGFDGPVGVRMEFDLDFPFQMPGILYSPVIVSAAEFSQAQARQARRREAPYWELRSAGQYASLVEPVFGVRDPRLLDRDRQLTEGKTQRFAFDLFPSGVEPKGPGKFCLDRLRTTATSSADDAKACFIFATAGGAVDLSEPMTRFIQKESRLLARYEGLSAIHSRWQADGLRRAGYVKCDDESMSYRDCYCRPAGKS